MKLAYVDPEVHAVIKLKGNTFSEILDGVPNIMHFRYALENIPPSTTMKDFGMTMIKKFGWIIESFEEREEETGMCCGGGCCTT